MKSPYSSHSAVVTFFESIKATIGDNPRHDCFSLGIYYDVTALFFQSIRHIDRYGTVHWLLSTTYGLGIFFPTEGRKDIWSYCHTKKTVPIRTKLASKDSTPLIFGRFLNIKRNSTCPARLPFLPSPHSQTRAGVSFYSSGVGSWGRSVNY